MKKIFDPNTGKVEIELFGTNIVLLWVTFEKLGVFRVFIITAGDVPSWEISSWLNSAKEKKQFILAQLEIPRGGPWSLQNMFHWTPIFDDAVRKALTVKVNALEIQEDQSDGRLDLIQHES